jgi:hypothetical protein
MTSQEVNTAIRQSLGMPAKPEPVSTVPQEGHVCDFPIWSYSKHRAHVTRIRINYEDGSFFSLSAPEGMPSPTFPGFLDCILFYGQKDLFVKEHTSMSIYQIFQMLHIDAGNGGNYAIFRKDMKRAFAMYIETDRFRNPETGKRSHVDYFRVMRRMKLAKSRREVSTFYFDELFLASLRSGYLKRLNFDYCLWLDREHKALARFIYGHLLKRLGEKDVYTRDFDGFLRDIGLGHLEELEPKRRTENLKRIVFPALETLKGEAIRQYELDDRGNIFFIPRD